MTLMDRIIDEAEELAYKRELPHPCYDEQIVDTVSDRVNVQLGYNSTGAKLALASYHRIDDVVRQVTAA